MATAQAPIQFNLVNEVFDRLGIPKEYLSHLKELRQRVLRCLFTFVFFFGFFFTFSLQPAGTLGGVQLYAPQFAPFEPISAQVVSRMLSDLIPPDVVVFQTTPYEIPVLSMHVAFVLAVIFSMPVILYQFGRFVMPALYAKERRELIRFVAPGLVMFAIGAVFAYAFVLPSLLHFMFEYSRELAQGSNGPVILISVSIGEALSFVMMLILAFGIVFELPLVMNLLTKLGLVQARTWWLYWRHAVVGFLVVGGFITPDTSGVTQLLVSVPMIGLYIGGALLATLGERRAREREEERRHGA